MFRTRFCQHDEIRPEKEKNAAREHTCLVQNEINQNNVRNLYPIKEIRH